MDQKKLTLHFICPGRDVLRVTTFGAQSLAESTIKTYEEFPINWEYLKEKTSEMLGLLRRAAGGGYSSGTSRILESIKELGVVLYKDLIPPSLRGKLDDAAGGDLLLSLDGNLLSLPWELFHDGRGFFCRRYSMGRIINIPPSARRPEKKRPMHPVKLLTVADPDGDLPGAFGEGLRIRDMMLDLEDRVEPVLLANRVKIASLLDGLRRCDVLHFAGHVDTDEEGTHLRLFDGRCSAARIKEFAGRHPFPCLVFVNACRSSYSDGKSFSINEGHERAFDLASSFLLSGARIFLGTLWDVRDAAANQAGCAFFRFLFSGMTVGAALAGMRDELINAFGESSMIWAGHVLYGDPGFRIGGALRISDRIFREMAWSETRCSEYAKTLDSSDPRERFFAAAALKQLGNLRGIPVLRKSFTQLAELLKSPSPLNRRQGQLILRIVTGSEMGYEADGDAYTRLAALEQCRSWWDSDESWTRINAFFDEEPDSDLLGEE